MKKSITLITLLFLCGSVMNAQFVQKVFSYIAPTDDVVLQGTRDIRGADFAADPFGTGVSAVATTSYSDNGHVFLFVEKGDDLLEMVWYSPKRLEAPSTPCRAVAFADLDNDGNIEIVQHHRTEGLIIWEWDGVEGSYNFGTEPAYVYTLPGGSPAIESFSVGDFDGDGTQEIAFASNASGSDNDYYYVLSASGTWEPGNPGFSSISPEFEALKGDLADYSLNGGSCYGMYAAQFDGVGNKEIMMHAWDFKAVSPLVVTGADTYKQADLTSGNAGLKLSEGDNDDVTLFKAQAVDIDGDGREELYMPTYGRGNIIHMIHYEEGQPLDQITDANVVEFDMNSGEDTSLVVGSTFGIGYGDLDANGKIDVYLSAGRSIYSMEFQGGDKTDLNNWKYKTVWQDDTTRYRKMIISDSLGVIDTAFYAVGGFISKPFAENTDFDSDGAQDIIVPMQAIEDSIIFITQTWSTDKWVADTSKILNPKRAGLQIIEWSNGTGIEVKELAMITPEDYKLEQNYPNPFNPSTNIRFSLPLNKNVSLKVYDMLGREVKTLLANQDMKKGAFDVTWDGTNNANQKVASGHYIATLTFGNFSKSIKMTLLK